VFQWKAQRHKEICEDGFGGKIILCQIGGVISIMGGLVAIPFAGPAAMRPAAQAAQHLWKKDAGDFRGEALQELDDQFKIKLDERCKAVAIEMLE
jgi:hypothetical protein